MGKSTYDLELENEVLRERDRSAGETMQRKLAEVVGLRETIQDQADQIIGLKREASNRDLAHQATMRTLRGELETTIKARDEAIEGKRILTATCNEHTRRAVEQETAGLRRRCEEPSKANSAHYEEHLKLKARIAELEKAKLKARIAELEKAKLKARIAELEKAPKLHPAAETLKPFPAAQAIGRPKRVKIVHNASSDCYGLPLTTVAIDPREVMIIW
jgi:hypothetical protein